jgi:chromosome segregation protein
MNLIEQNSDDKIEYDHLVTQIDSEILILNRDYKMTYEGLIVASDIEDLGIPISEASIDRENLRAKLENLGFVNLEAIDEYNKVSGDYEELKTNTNDLRKSRKSLLETITTMDKIMLDIFETMFDKINNKFDETFKILFRGGDAKLIYSEPDNILESGIEIIVKAPGKVIQNMSLFSGGEKALSALSLIFAINLVRNLPLLILDEPEAALDEANVERFAKFAKKINETSQVLITTHRPGTMEKADIIYGVTMQPKGITKIVSVKLDDAVEMVK